ncbi:hypothetical protein RIVM261_037100 [Rivularia sp. IAM M-261]|nr:hypothetical protein RIVM261_037100 [Rivularia sp. IAM M-261]
MEDIKVSTLKFSLPLLGLTVTSVVSTCLSHRVVANEINFETMQLPDDTMNQNVETTQTEKFTNNSTAPELLDNTFSSDAAPISGEISYQAADLQVSSNLKSTSDTTNNTSGWAITPEIGTLGVGASVTKSLTPNLNARVGVNAASISVGGYQKRRNEVTYDANLDLLNVSTLVDYHPFQNSGFRVSGGLVFNDNKVEGRGRIRDKVEFEYNNNRYTTKDISSVKGKVSFPNNIAPYLGIGWGNAVKPGNRWGFSANLGVIFAGAPQVSLDADIVNESLREQINRDLRVEERELEDDIKGFKFYPVVSVGVSYQF